VPAEIPHKNISRLKIIAASRFSHEKGLDVFIKAISLLDKEIRAKADFTIAGDGGLKKELMHLNKETGANVSFPGNVNDMYKLLSGSHIFVYPSRSKTEGFPAVITEAGANGMLVISSDFYGVTDVIENGKDGVIFKKEDTKDLAKKLAASIRNFEKYKKLSDNFYIKIKDWFSLDKMINKHLELYRKCGKA
jgi:GalNAc-alpha-(1->4)-GalNAc-alpha-(1->3)-diNAcBac-PP-undecaprenol alpha-1,4-N-acetyl-D-galactosaminyltransferase